MTFERLGVEFRIVEAIHVDVDIARHADPIDRDAVNLQSVDDVVPGRWNPVRFRARHGQRNLILSVDREVFGDRLAGVLDPRRAGNC